MDLQNLPHYIESLSSIIMQLMNVTNERLVALQYLTVLLIENFPKLPKPFHWLAIRAIIVTLCNLAECGGTYLDDFLSNMGKQILIILTSISGGRKGKFCTLQISSHIVDAVLIIQKAGVVSRPLRKTLLEVFLDGQSIVHHNFILEIHITSTRLYTEACCAVYENYSTINAPIFGDLEINCYTVPAHWSLLVQEYLVTNGTSVPAQHHFPQIQVLRITAKPQKLQVLMQGHRLHLAEMLEEAMMVAIKEVTGSSLKECSNSDMATYRNA